MNTMKRFTRHLALTIALAALSVSSAFAQAVTTQTTLTNAVTTPTPANQTATTSVVLASITNVQVGGFLFVSDGTGEEMQVLAVPSAATSPVTVLRGVDGTRAAAHPANALVWVASTATIQSAIFRHGPRTGVCVPSQEASLPQINVDTGDIFNCNPNTLTAGVPTAWLWGSASTVLDWPAMPVTLVSDADYTIQPSDTFVVYQTMTAVRKAVIGAMSIPGKMLTIVNNSNTPFTISVVGLIAGSSTYTVATNASLQIIWSGVKWFKI